MSAASTAARRLRRDLEALQQSGNPQILVRPSEENLLEWHFVLHDLPSDTVYEKGCYHGKIIFPSDYPHAPPSIFMLTPSGRLETNTRLCLSMTDFHPESWNPAWSARQPSAREIQKYHRKMQMYLILDHFRSFYRSI